MVGSAERRRLFLLAGLSCGAAVACLGWAALPAGGIHRSLFSLLLAATATAVYLARRLRLQVRSERRAWEQLASTTDDLNNALDLEAILRTAAHGARELTGATSVEVELWGIDSTRTVRVGDADVLDDRLASAMPYDYEQVASCAIAARTSAPIGTIRLHLRNKLDRRERTILRTLGIAVATAVARADAYSGAVEAAQDAARQARHDTLTGLLNRRGLIDLLTEQLKQAALHRPALAMLDLDGFKGVNDTLGHAAGDQLLIDVAQRLQSAAAAHQASAARLGGDEFAVLFPSVPTQGAAVASAEDVVRCLDAPVAVHGMSVIVRGSTGVAIAEPGITSEDLLQRTDQAMYRAKRGHMPVVLYREDQSLRQSYSVSAELSHALAHGQITVLIEPIVHLGTGELVGYEVIPVWKGVQGIASPSAWLDLVEHSDQLAAATEYVLDRALAAGASLRSVGVDVPVTLNISQRSLMDVRFPHIAMGFMQVRNIQPHHLILELTETAGLSHVDAVHKTLTTLRRAGVRLSVDHFGSSNSTLAVLTRMPVIDGLKISPSIVDAIPTSRQAELVIRAATRLGDDLGISHHVGAEGITNAIQRRTLWDLGCRTGQGSLFGTPTSVEQTASRLRESRAGSTNRIASPLPENASTR